MRLCLRDGAEVIKVYASGSLHKVAHQEFQLTVEELKAIVDEAHGARVKVTDSRLRGSRTDERSKRPESIRSNMESV